MEVVLNVIDLPPGLQRRQSRAPSPEGTQAADSDGVEVEVQHVVSSRLKLGDAVATCVAGCACQQVELKGNLPVPEDTVGGQRLLLTQLSSRCKLRITADGSFALLGIVIHWNNAAEPVLAL